MSPLTTILRDLASKATPAQATATRLPSGLRVSARVLPDGRKQLSLTRNTPQKPSQQEAETCLNHIGWLLATIELSTTRSGLPCLLITEAVQA